MANPGPEVLELLTRMRGEGFSRNRNFDAFAHGSAGGRARRLARWLRSLERDLAASGDGPARLQVEPIGGGGRRITIERPGIRLRRIATLSAEEFALLAADEKTGRILGV